VKEQQLKEYQQKMEELSRKHEAEGNSLREELLLVNK